MVRLMTNFHAGRVISVGLSGLRLSSGSVAVSAFDALSSAPMVVRPSRSEADGSAAAHRGRLLADIRGGCSRLG